MDTAVKNLALVDEEWKVLADVHTILLVRHLASSAAGWLYESLMGYFFRRRMSS